MRSNRPLASSFTMWSILLFLGSILMGVGVFMVTQSARQHESGIEEISRSIQAERQSIRVLEAEWAYLSRPQRLEELMAMKQDQGEMPPAPAPIATVLPDAAMMDVQPAAGVTEAPVEPEIAKAERVTEEPVKTSSVETVPAEKPVAKKETSKPAVKKAQAKQKVPVKTASHEGAWPIAKKQATYKPAPIYRPVASNTRGGMRPIVE